MTFIQMLGGLVKFGSWKIPAGLLGKLVGMVFGVTTVTAAVIAGAPIYDPWFDALGVTVTWITVASIINGEPDPEVFDRIQRGTMTMAQFCYLWFFNSSHLFIQSASSLLRPRRESDQRFTSGHVNSE